MRFALALAFLPALLAQAPTGPTIPDMNDANPDLVKLVAYDQWDRGDDMFGNRQPPAGEIDWDAVSKRDTERREAVRKLLAEGKLTTGKDYRFAALILQHSPDSAGYLQAHVLATTAIGKGDTKARWLAAATLDRYLQSLNQPQIFGTQFRKPGANWTQEPFDREAVSEVVRASWCVASLAEQQLIEKDIQAGKPFRSTAIKDCK